MLARSLPFSLVACLLALPSCSAIVSPNPARLGGTDGGPSSGIDAAGSDAAPGDDAPDPTIDGGPPCPASCDDGVACTNDVCRPGSGVCQHLPNDGACRDGMRCVATGCVAILCATDADCDDADACNGEEACRPGTPGASPATGCAASDPLDCDDGFNCTVDRCEPSSGCTHEGNDGACDDGIDCTSETCTPTGCAYTLDSASCNGPCRAGATCMFGVGCTGGAMMTCAPDGNPCTSDPTSCDVATGSCLHPPRDGDGDGFTAASATGTGGVVVTCPGGTDCNDGDAAVNPSGVEVCNGRDDDCDGMVDDGAMCGLPGPEDCATAQPIMLTAGAGGMTGTVTASTVMNVSDYTTGCGRSGGRDAVYYVDLAGGAGGAVDVVITTNHATTTFDTVLAAQVGNSCGAWSGPCNDDISGSNTSTVRMCVMLTFLMSTRVYILVDGYDSSASGTFTMSVTVTPRAGGVCT